MNLWEFIQLFVLHYYKVVLNFLKIQNIVIIDKVNSKKDSEPMTNFWEIAKNNLAYYLDNGSTLKLETYALKIVSHGCFMLLAIVKLGMKNDFHSVL